MSWSVSGIVDNGDTEDLEQNFSNNHPSTTDEVREQFEWVLEAIAAAFDAGVVDGYYSVSANGHSDPTQEGDRKHLSLSFTAYVRPEATASEEIPQTLENTAGTSTPDELPIDEDEVDE